MQLPNKEIKEKISIIEIKTKDWLIIGMISAIIQIITSLIIFALFLILFFFII